MAGTEDHRILLYGATGYTGRLAAAVAAERGLPVVLGGRSAEKLAKLGAKLNLATRVVDLADAAGLTAALADLDVVLHLAGPYRDTAAPMLAACFETGTHYVDITGEFEVFADHAGRDAAARAAGITLLTGAGFDVVPSDCLAAYVAGKVESPTELKLFFSGGAGMSQGTMKSGLSMVGGGTPVRRNDKIVHLARAPIASCDFGKGVRQCTAMAWGDLVTAAHSTGIGNIAVYFDSKPFPPPAGIFTPVVNWLVGTRVARFFLRTAINRMPEGPTDEQRARAQQVLVAEARGAGGESARAKLETPEAYTLTAHTCVEAARRVAAGEVAVGYQTPVTAFGPDFITGFEGVSRWD